MVVKDLICGGREGAEYSIKKRSFFHRMRHVINTMREE